jgi:recombinational DNA repair protein (RecF pathway)
MAIEKNSTEALVLGVYTVGEYDAIVSLYTKDFGVITAKATSLKKSRKMRAHLIVGRLTSVTLVKGKEIYRLVGSSEINKRSQILFIVVECVKRFFHGEEKNSKLFDRLVSYTNIPNANESHLKTCVYLDILINLGYLDIEKLGMTKSEYIETDTNSFYVHSFLKKNDAVVAIKQAIDSSML